MTGTPADDTCDISKGPNQGVTIPMLARRPAYCRTCLAEACKHWTVNASGYWLLVGKALTVDRFTLDGFPVLSQLPVVEQWATSHPRALLPRGTALQSLLRRAVADVVTSYSDADDASLRRIADYVRLRYQVHQSVAAIAQQWQLHRSYVSRSLSQRAVQVVTHRFLQLVEGVRWSMDERTTAHAG